MTTEFITKPATSLLQRVITNRQTSAAAIVYFGAKALVHFLKIWMPSHQAQLDQTEQWVEHTAVAYGLLMAGDSKPKQTT